MVSSDNIAIVGAGVSGLVAAYILGKKHRVTLFEKSAKLGGHARTEVVTDREHDLLIDTGFVVFDELNYPYLCRLFDTLNIKTQATNMSFSVRCEKSGLEYNGSNINTFFSQRNNLLKPWVWLILKDIIRFNNESIKKLNSGLDDSISVGEFFQNNHYSRQFFEKYLVPLGASIWSCHEKDFTNFPIRFVIQFLHNHGLLQITKRPIWRTISGGSYEYVRELQKKLGSQIRLNAHVNRVERKKKGVLVHWNDNYMEMFDEVIMATHADTSMHTVANLDQEEYETLEKFAYGDSEGCLHTDTKTLPDNRRAWASWNYRLPTNSHKGVSICYNMNLLQNLDTAQTYCMSLNQNHMIDPKKVIKNIRFRHPIFRAGRDEAQEKHGLLIRRNGISYCGSYWGYGFHEDGIKSAISVCNSFSIEPPF